MKKALAFYIALFCGLSTWTAMGAAVTIKKASPIAQQKPSEGLDGVLGTSSASMVSTVLNVVNGVQTLTKNARELTAECVPTSSEIEWVNKMVKEWAKIGAASADDIQSKLKRAPCDDDTDCYATQVKNNMGLDDITPKYNHYPKNDPYIWAGFPKAAKGEYCPNDDDCGKNKKTVSDIYEIFDLVASSFSTEDYTEDEASMAAKLNEKMERCAPAKLKAKKAALAMDFLTGTVGNVGQKTNTGNIMEQVQGVLNSGGFGGGLQSLGGLATQLLEK